ncbi:MAG: ABC transporter substrate-binding protein [Phycisphaerae bacterium]|nr:ABC transporter substrate-binding protein [Phycisphaerae bacterium]
MEHRFGLKDLIVIVLLLLIGVSVWLSMVQKNRDWRELQRIASRVDEMGRRMEEIAATETMLSDGMKELSAAVKSRPLAAAPLPGQEDAEAASAASPRDAAWARPNVPIEWFGDWTYTTDPRTDPNYRAGGEFFEVFEAQPPKIVPYIAEDVYSRRVYERVVEPLGTFDANTLKPRGVLADAWQMDPDGLWFRVHLNPKATFSDGKPVTSEDVRWTVMDYVFNPLIEAVRTRSTLDMIEAVNVIDDHTVEFVFNKAVFTNLSYTMGLYVLPKHYYSQFEPSQINQATGLLMGSGAFRLPTNDPDQQWAPPADLKLIRNDRYWAANARSPLAAMRYRAVNDELSRLTAYRKGECSMIMPTPAQFVSVSKEPGWQERSWSLNWNNMRSPYSFIGWQCGPRAGKKLTPFSDQRVRQAMTLMLDRERMIRDIWEGIGVLAKGSVNPDSPASNPSISPWPYDQAKARELLAEAGWIDRDGDGVIENPAGDEFEFELTRPAGGETAERIGKFLKDACTKVGIRCNTRVIDWAGVADILKSRDFDAIIMSWGANAPESDPKQIFHSDSMREGGDNFVQWKSEAADRAIDQIRTTIDFDARMKAWHTFGAVLHEEQPYTFVRIVPWLRFVNKEFGNVQTYRSGMETWEFFNAGPLTPGPVS